MPIPIPVAPLRRLAEAANARAGRNVVDPRVMLALLDIAAAVTRLKDTSHDNGDGTVCVDIKAYIALSDALDGVEL